MALGGPMDLTTLISCPVCEAEVVDVNIRSSGDDRCECRERGPASAIKVADDGLAAVNA